MEQEEGEARGQCERHPLCVRGYKHGERGGLCRLAQVEQPAVTAVDGLRLHLSARNARWFQMPSALFDDRAPSSRVGDPRA